jgi:hypothetical protein
MDSSLGFPKPVRPAHGASLYDASEVDAWFAARSIHAGAKVAANDAGAPEAKPDTSTAFEVDALGQYTLVSIRPFV